MDNANIDYASVLQGGLDSSTVNALFMSLANYLQGVATNTSSNNVLESAYANLFGLSMTDMYAFSQLASRPNEFATAGNTLTETANRLQQLSSGDITPLSEKIDNVLSNLQFAFGEDIASTDWKYGTWKAGNLAMDIGNALSESGVAKGIGKGLNLLGAGMLAVDIVPTIADMVWDVATTGVKQLANNENGVVQLFNATTGSTVSGKSLDFKTLRNEQTARNSAEGSSYGSAKEYDEQLKEEEAQGNTDPSLTILKEIEKTLMKNTEGNYAVAVSLQGMSNEVLKSFASIFADEEAMTDVFKTKKSKNKLFDYDAEPTSNNSTGKKGSTASTSPRK